MTNTLTKADIVESVHDQLGFQKNESAEKEALYHL